MKNSILRTFIVVFVLALLPTIELCAEESSESITVFAVDDVNPFSFTLPDGRQTGLYVEFWELWSKSNNIPVNIILTPLEEAFQATKDKKGIYSGLFINDERKQWADFSLPIHSVKTGVLYNNKFPKTTILSQAKGIKVAVQIASYQANYLEENFPDIELLYFDGLEKGIAQLLNNEIQAIVAEIPTVNARLAKLELTGVFTLADEELLANTVHSAIGKGQPKLLEQINRGIENIPLKELIALEQKWLPTLKPFFKDMVSFEALTIAEKKWLLRNSHFRLGIDSHWFPFDFIDSKGSFSGVSSDYINYVSETLNISLEPDIGKSWSEAFAALKLGDIDVISAIVKTPERSKILNFTQPYFTTTSVITTRKNSFYAQSMDALNNKVVGLVEGFALNELIKKDYPLIKIYDVRTIVDGLEKLQSGEIDAFISAMPVINYEIEKRQLDDLVIAAFAPYKFEISMAVRKGLEPLVPILNKTFANMSEKQRAGIANNWLAVQIQTGLEIKTILVWGVPILSLLMLVIIIIVRINRRLKNEITIREKSEKERLMLESQLHQSLKMEALGKLTGGIAHDFNNMLGVIQGYSELLIMQLPKKSKLTDFANQIHHAGERGAKLTKRLLSFTQKQSRDATKIDINDLVQSQIDMLQKTLTVRIKLLTDFEDEVWSVWIDGNELEDALLNLSINAMHAMADTLTLAEMTIKTSNRFLNELEAKTLGLEKGDYVLLSIKDTGCGMDESIKEKVFDPFFTTKGENGSGLGLSQVFGFVHRTGGTIKVVSAPSRGSEFELYFPKYESDADEPNVKNEENPAMGGNETILIVDDEVALSNLAFEILVNHGYKVFNVTSGKDALDIMANESIELLLSDVIMPEMDGYQLANIVQERYPAIKIQMVSGFSEKHKSTKYADELHNKLIYKPYRTRLLLKTIRALLDS